MKQFRFLSVIFIILMTLIFCNKKNDTFEIKIIFLHHSIGRVIWNGKPDSGLERFVRNKSNRLSIILGMKAQLPAMLDNYNKENRKNYLIKEMVFPKAKLYGWNNFPYDYYNIWVKNAGPAAYMQEPTLEMLIKDYQVIIFKHCFPVCKIQPDLDSADINSDMKTISNYKLQYLALRDKLHEFPDTKFILFTGAALVKSAISEDEAERAKEFFTWVTYEWDQPGDNIYLWDLYNLQTEGGLYFKDEYSVSFNDSHPNEEFAGKVTKLMFNRIFDVIDNNGDGTQLTGESNYEI